MDCCGHGVTRRGIMRSALLGGAGAALGCARGPAPIAGASDEPSAGALSLLRDHVSVDVHTHGGPNGVGGAGTQAPGDTLARGMRAGHIAMVCLADVPDGPVLGRDASNVLRALRVPAPGELYQHHLNRLAWIDELVARHGVRRVLTVADMDAAHRAGEPAIIMDVEGLDFLERKLERLEESYRRGIRTMQLVHYTPNDIGDFQTGAVTHKGLTEFGGEVIRACEKLGVVVDVAHGTEAMVTQALRVATKPLLLSHTALRGSKAQGQTALTERQITPEHARAIAQTGGSVGIWHFFPSLARYVDGLKEMVDVAGVDHVSIGTDASASGGLFPQYDPWARLVDAMLAGGFSRDETAKIIGGNYRRIFSASVR